MHCPTCSSTLLSRQTGLFTCPGGHGTLVTSKHLRDLELAESFAEPEDTNEADTSHEIGCPHCSVKMHKVDYNSMDINIDACTNCHYRWLDSGEITKIKNHKPDIAAKDLLFIAALDNQIHQTNNREVKEANPRLPMGASYRTGAEVLTRITGDHRVRLSAIVGQGLFGIVKGLVHSKTTRIVTIATLAVFGLLFYFVALEARNIF